MKACSIRHGNRVLVKRKVNKKMSKKTKKKSKLIIKILLSITIVACFYSVPSIVAKNIYGKL